MVYDEQYYKDSVESLADEGLNTEEIADFLDLPIDQVEDIYNELHLREDPEDSLEIDDFLEI